MLDQTLAVEGQQALQLLHAIASSSSDAIFAKDERGRYLLINEAAARFMGQPVHQLLGRDDRSVFPSEQAAEIMANDRHVFESGQTETIEEFIQTAHGEKFFLATKGPLRNAQGQTFGTFGISRDVTERKKLEDSLRQSEAHYRELFEANPHPMWVYDIETLAFLAVNGAAVHRYGYSRDEFLRMTLKDIRPPEDVAPLLQNIALVSGGLDEAGIWRHLTKDGRLIEVEITSHAMQFDDRPSELVLAHDVTRQRAAERTLRTSEAQLKQAQQMAQILNATLEARVDQRTAELTAAIQELDSFAYTVSHDLRAPLRAMGGFAHALQEDHGDALPLGAKTYLDQIVLAGRKMSDLVEGLLTLSRSTRGDLRMDRVDMSALAQKRLVELAAAEPARRVSVEIENGLVLQGDIRMLSSVVNNLLENAWKYTGSAIQPKIRVHACDVDGRLGFCVSDNGAGFDMAHAARLFKPFQRLHRQDEFPGVGIGLATVQRIVQRHGGQIIAHGAPGQGATFSVVLPGTAGRWEDASTT